MLNVCATLFSCDRGCVGLRGVFFFFLILRAAEDIGLRFFSGNSLMGGCRWLEVCDAWRTISPWKQECTLLGAGGNAGEI